MPLLLLLSSSWLFLIFPFLCLFFLLFFYLVPVMNAKVDGRSARGRPRFGWMDGVKRALNDRRMDIREASERARNRNEWRMIVTQF